MKIGTIQKRQHSNGSAMVPSVVRYHITSFHIYLRSHEKIVPPQPLWWRYATCSTSLFVTTTELSPSQFVFAIIVVCSIVDAMNHALLSTGIASSTGVNFISKQDCRGKTYDLAIAVSRSV
jgi:hypothetical protein